MKLDPSTLQIDFKNRRALVTGAGKGIGREIAAMLHRFNAQVVAVSRTESDLKTLQEEIGCETIVADLGDAAQARRMAEQAGDVDLLVNNAAIAILEPLLETTVEAWDATMAINLRTVMIVSQVIAKRMIERGVAGSIVNISSLAAYQALPHHAAYAASKAGLDQFSKVMAVELGPHGIRVNSINPTVVMTDMGKRAWSDPAKGGPMLARIPLGRFAECADIASVVCFVLSDAAGMVNGLAMLVDGGFWTTQANAEVRKDGSYRRSGHPFSGSGGTPVRAQTRGPVSQGGRAVVIQASHQYGPGLIRKIVRGLTLTSRFENVPTQAEKAEM